MWRSLQQGGCNSTSTKFSHGCRRTLVCVNPLKPLSGQARKAVGTPLLAADTVVDEEEPVRIEFRLDSLQLRIVLAPELLPPRGIEEVAFVEIRARVRRDLAQLGRSHVDPTGFLSCLGHV